VDAGGDLFDKNEAKFRYEIRATVAVKRPSAVAVIDTASA
jgi:hypothetical protein